MRARQGGIPRPVSVELVSALKGWGVEELLVRLHREVGSTGDVWVVSTQSDPSASPRMALVAVFDIYHQNPKFTPVSS